MKSDDIRRSVRANRHERSAGDAPSMGRVARMAGTGLPKSKRSRRRKSGVEDLRESRSSRNRQQAIWIWTSLLAGFALVSVTLAAWLWLFPKMAEDGEVARSEPILAEPIMPLSFKFPPPSERAAVAMVKRALAIRDPAEVADFFRPCDTSPAAIIHFLRGMESSDGKISGFNWLSNMDSKGIPVEGVLVTFDGESGSKSRLALLTPDAAGNWKTDFDALARTVRPSWEELEKQNTSSGLLRVNIAKDTYYNGVFGDDEHWLCYAMASPDTELVFMGYCKVDSPQAAALEWIFSNEDRINRVTLEVRRVEGAEPRQFEISRILAADWIVGDVPFDEGFRE